MSTELIKTVKTAFLNDPTFKDKWKDIFREILSDKLVAEFEILDTRINTGFWTLDNLYQFLLENARGEHGDRDVLEKLKETLEKSGCMQIHGAIQDFHPTYGSPIWFNIKPGIDPFYGRDKEISKLFHIYSKQTSGDIVTLCGLPGMGKTELVKQFLHNKQIKTKVPTAWVRADSAANFKTDIISLAKLVLPDAEGQIDPDPVELLQNIAIRINKQTRQKWIFVLDEYAGPDVVDLQILNTLPESGAMVILICYDRHFHITNNLIDVTELDEESALNFVKYNLDTETETWMKELARFVHNYPHALEQATLYIQYKQKHDVVKYTIEDYIKECKKKSENLISIKLPQLGGSKYEKTISETLATTIDRVREQSLAERGHLYAFKLLQLIAHLGRDNVDLNFLKKIFNPCEPSISEEIFHASLNLLRQLCLIKCENKGCLQMNSIVQEVVRVHCIKSGVNLGPVGPQYLHKILKNLQIGSLSGSEMRHVLSIWDHTLREEVSFKKVSPLAPKIYSRLDKLFLYSESLEFAKTTVQFLSGDDLPLLIEMKQNYGLSLRRLGKGKEAVAYLELLVKEYPIDQPTLLSLKTLQHLANSYYTIKQFEKALHLYKEVCEGKKLFFAADSQEIYQCESNTSGALIDLERFGEAEEKLRFAHDWLIANGKAADALRVAHSLGYCYYKMKKYQEAKEQFDQVLQKKSDRGEGNDPRALITRYMCARSSFHLNDKDGAISELQEVYEEQVRLIGKDNQETIDTKEKIDKYLAKQDHPQEADSDKAYEHDSPKDEESNISTTMKTDTYEVTTSKTMIFSQPLKDFDQPLTLLDEIDDPDLLKVRYLEQKRLLKEQKNYLRLKYHERMALLLKNMILRTN